MSCRLMHAVTEIVETGMQKADIELTCENETFCKPRVLA